MKIFVDASRNRSGGAIEYLVGVFNSENFASTNDDIYIYAPKEVLLKISQKNRKIRKKSHWMIESNIFVQLMWQLIVVPFLFFFKKFDILFTTDASTVSYTNNMVVMSQDMLSYEPGIMSLYPIGLRKLRLKLIYFIQNQAFKRSKGVIFLTNYAAETIQKHTGKIKNYAVIPHGIDSQNKISFNSDLSLKDKINLIYVSNAAPYKNQWSVVEGTAMARRSGLDLRLSLVGGGEGLAQEKTNKSIKKVDPHKQFIKQYEYLDRKLVKEMVNDSDIYVFASSCENLPVTLLEGMACGLPILCSDKGPMPEVLKDAGFYFNPYDKQSFSSSLLDLIYNNDQRMVKQNKAYLISKEYTWENTAKSTLKYLSEFNK